MKFSKIADYIESASKLEIIATSALVLIIIAVIYSIIYIAVTFPKIYKRQINELHIINQHLAHIDHNNYETPTNKEYVMHEDNKKDNYLWFFCYQFVTIQARNEV